MSVMLRKPVGPDDHVIGPSDAPVTLLEYGDYECPHCKAAQPVIAAVREELADSLRFAFRHFPLTAIHPHAERAAEMAEAAAMVGRFWPMHELLFAMAPHLEDEHLLRGARSVGLDAGFAMWALRMHAYAGEVREDFASGVRSGVNGTPTFFINDVRHDGSWNVDSLLTAIHSAMVSAAPR